MADVIQLRISKTYTAKPFKAHVSELEFLMSGTLDGFIDLHISGAGCTYILTCDEARMIASALNSVVEDVQKNCLFDQDALLAKGARDD